MAYIDNEWFLFWGIKGKILNARMYSLRTNKGISGCVNQTGKYV